MLSSSEIFSAVKRIAEPFTWDRETLPFAAPSPSEHLEVHLPSVPIDLIGSRSFCERYHLDGAYVGGSMARGIASEDYVIGLTSRGFLAFFGAAGLPLERVEQAIHTLQQKCGERTFGVNLIHSPDRPQMEESLAHLFIEKGVSVIEASAFLKLEPSIVHYKAAGLHVLDNGQLVAKNRVIAKVSRVEVARQFLSPPPEEMLRSLVEQNKITSQQAKLAENFPVADDLTVEADSGGHTDNRPAISLIPTMVTVRDELTASFGYDVTPEIGAAGGIATPHSIAAAFAMGAGYVVTGSINQSCVESGTSRKAKQMLVDAGQADIAMAPSSDMFEMGVKVQVLKRGTMFPMRASKLYEIYRQNKSVDEISPAERMTMEKQIFRKPLSEVWDDVARYFTTEGPEELIRAEKDPHHKLALICRSYLGLASQWAVRGLEERAIDFQIWCGAAMGAFNEWTKGSYLEEPSQRSVGLVALNLMYGACVLKRLEILRLQGVQINPQWKVRPMIEDELKQNFV